MVNDALVAVLAGLIGDIMTEIVAEADRAVDKHGPQLMLPDFSVNGHQIISADRARTTTDVAHERDTLSWGDVLLEEVAEAFEETSDVDALRTELVQCAAVVLRWIISIDVRNSLEKTGHGKGV